jgi:hypothetical protein
MSTATSPATTSLRARAESESRLRGRWLVLARIACLSVSILALAIWGWGVPFRYQQLGTVCTTAPCGDQQLTVADIQHFQQAGVSLGFYAAYIGTIEVLFALVFLALAAAIFWLRSDTSIGLLTTVFLATFGVTQTSGSALAAAVPAWAIPVNLLQPLSYICLILFLYLFPDGRFVPRWARFVALVWGPLFLIGSAVLLTDVFVALLFGFMAVSLGAQVYRYRRVSTSTQRQQTKWVVLGLLIGLLGTIGIISAGNLVMLSGLVGMWGILAGNALIYLFGAIVPLSIAIAILRSRLWDIDTIINKALVYGSLTVVLAAIYFGGVVGAQAVVQTLTGARTLPAYVIVASTLLIAALFSPLRRRIQATIDRRFYRRKYDASKTLADFGATLRSEVELVQLKDHLLAVVEHTMQPEHVSVWLSPPKREAAR